jgi:bacterioferritin-associated ferredoxin
MMPSTGSETLDFCRGRIVCRCLQVTETELSDALATDEVRTLHDVRRLTGAGTGCMSCHRMIKEYLARERYASPSSSALICSER